MSDLLFKAIPAVVAGWGGPLICVERCPHGSGPATYQALCTGRVYATGPAGTLHVDVADPQFSGGWTFKVADVFLDLERDECVDRVVRVLMAALDLDGAACWTGDEEGWQLGDPLGEVVEFAWEGDPGRVIVPELECVQNPRDALLIVANHVFHGEVPHG